MKRREREGFISMVFWRKKLPLLEIDPATMSTEADRFMLSSSVAFLAKYQESCHQYGFDDVGEWHIDQNSGKFTATTRKGKYVADFQVFASSDLETETWEWAWSNPNVDYDLKADSRRIKAFGDIKGIKSLTCPLSKLPDDDDEAVQIISVLLGMALEIAISDVLFMGDWGPMRYYLGLKNIRSTWLRPPTLG